MKMSRVSLFLPALILPRIFAQQPSGAVMTQHNNNARTGAYTQEMTLTTANVNVNQFGLIFRLPVDGEVYAQPLYLPNVVISGKGTQNVAVEIGILSTPVIDVTTGTIYAVALTVENGKTLALQLHALSLSGGTEEFGGPVTIQASVPGTGVQSLGGVLPFRAGDEWQRTSLLLSNGIISAGFGSHGDDGEWHGCVIGYKATTLAMTYAFCTTPDGQEGGVWQSGNGLAADAAGNIYFFSGNGDFNANTGGRDYGDSLVKLNPSSQPLVEDYFTPYNQAALDSADLDLGSGAPIVLAHDGLVVGAGKNGTMYVTSQNHLGGFNPSGDTQIVQWWQASYSATGAARISSGPVFLETATAGLLYVWPSQDYLKSFQLVNGKFTTTPASQSTFTSPTGCSRSCRDSAALSLSSNGTEADSAIVWANLPSSGSFDVHIVPGVLRAFAALDLTKELWNSNLNASRDDLGNVAKFVPPTVANGKVYMANFSGTVNVYGLLTGN